MRNRINLARLEISAADPSLLLTQIAQHKITLYGVSRIDALTLEVQIDERKIPDLRTCVNRLGGSVDRINSSAVSRLILQLPKRMVLFVGVVVIALLTVWIPSRVLFVKVSGNVSVPTNLILATAKEYGVDFGAIREDMRSEEIKNNLISAIPQLRWVGVNTWGCVAEISVSERTETIAGNETENVISNIVAGRDGVIISKTILQGTDLCKVGEVVSVGQLLVSGYSDCGIVIRASEAKAEILAKTRRVLCMVTPTKYMQRRELLTEKTRYGVMIGKKLIKFYKGSGISGGSCAKIYKRDYIQLPGGYCLPVCFITEYIYTYETQMTELREVDWLDTFADSYLLSQMVAGQILGAEKAVSVGEESVWFTGQYDCTEMIGRRTLEENIDIYGACN